jgi:hypothetical protein
MLLVVHLPTGCATSVSSERGKEAGVEENLKNPFVSP